MVVKHCCVESNPSGGRVNWMECLSSQLAISNYSVSKWMETKRWGGKGGSACLEPTERLMSQSANNASRKNTR